MMPKTRTTASYRELIDDAAKRLHEVSASPRIDVEVLLQHVTQRPLAWLLSWGDTQANSDHVRDFYSLVEQRQQGQPIAYLLGYKEFWSLKLGVNDQVLIPRADTETLVENALACLPPDVPLDILDLGTGSGAIALSIAKHRPLAHVLAVDSQAGALEVARSNAKSNGLGNVKFLLSNWFCHVPSDYKFDLIATNPPYIEPRDPHLQQGDLRFEPSTALISDDNGLADLKTIIETAPRYLRNRGWLIVEHGYNQAQEVVRLFKTRGYTKIERFKDINDLPRCTIGRYYLSGNENCRVNKQHKDVLS